LQIVDEKALTLPKHILFGEQPDRYAGLFSFVPYHGIVINGASIASTINRYSMRVDE
jgi:hypothetical protein